MNFLRTIIIYFIFTLSFVVPRDKRQFIYIGWHRTKDGEIFADNTKYLYLYAHANTHDSKHTWLAKSHELVSILKKYGFSVVYEKSLAGIWHQLRAGNFVIDAFLQPQNFMFSGYAKIIQLTHGKGMKKGGYNEKQLRKQNYIFSTSSFTESLLPNIFKHGANCFVTGYPRNDIFFSEKKLYSEKENEYVALINKLHAEGKKVILYAPTFRRKTPLFPLDKVLDLKQTEIWSRNKKVHFLISLHTKYRNQLLPENLENVSFLDPCDFQSIFKRINILITDYSSSFVDFLLLDRPIIFYPFDLDEYSNREGLVADYDSITPGPKAFTFEALLIAIENTLTNPEDGAWKEARARVRKRYHLHTDGQSAERIVTALKKEGVSI